MKRAYVIGTCDTKADELLYVRDLIAACGCEAILLDVGTSGTAPAAADVDAHTIASRHPGGAEAVFVGDRGRAVAAMAEALTIYLAGRTDVAGAIGLGGSGGSSVIAPALQALPIGLPKILVSTLASGDVSAYVGASDVNIFHPVTDVSGVNRVSRKLLGNAAHALVGMIRHQPPVVADARPVVTLSMFGVTTPAVQAMTAALRDDFDCIVFHATGNGGRSMEQLIGQGDVAGVLDITTTEICDLLVGGVLSAGETRLDSIAATGVPYVGSCGALDMVNFWAADTVPGRFAGRLFYEHNAQVTLMRTTAAECEAIGTWIGRKLNACEGEVRFLLPLRGVSALDREGGPFFDPEADRTLFEALERTVVQTASRRLIPLDHHINDAAFADEATRIFRSLM